MTGTRNRLVALAAVAVALAVASGGCSCSVSPNQSPSGSQAPSGSPSGASTGSVATSTAGATQLDDIPPGRSIAESGGGPLTYTFREEWRKARAEAQKWRSGAYLIFASGNFPNDDGVPSTWTLDFIDKAVADAVLLVEIDPWGKVTKTQEVTGGSVSVYVGPNKRIPYSIIDSDRAVELGKAALATRYDLSSTKDPAITLGFSGDGGGPYWTYATYNYSLGKKITAQIDALTGNVKQLS
jgi:hypothetical protein